MLHGSRRCVKAADREGLDAVILYGAHRELSAGRPALLRAVVLRRRRRPPQLFVPADGPCVLMTDAGWDVDRARAEAYADDMRLTQGHGCRPVAALVREHAADGRAPRVGIAGYGFFPAPVYLTLARAAARRDAHRRRPPHGGTADGA